MLKIAFADNINPKINLAASGIQGVLGRQIQALNLASQSACLLKTAITNMLSSLAPSAAGVLECISANINLRLPQCALDSLNEVNLLLQTIDANIDLALSVAGNLISLASKMATLKIENPTTPSNCSDASVTKFLGAVGLGGSLPSL